MYTTLVGALYVLVPALLLLLAMVWAWCNPVVISEEAVMTEAELSLYASVRDIYAHKAINAIEQYRHAVSSGNMRAAKVWLDQALEQHDIAVRYDARCRMG